MATSGNKSVTVTQYDTLKFSWWINSDDQSIENNTTTVRWKLELIAGTYGRINSSVSKPWTVTVNGKKYEGNTTVGIANNATKTLANGTTIITHDSDGSKTFSYSFSQSFTGITFSGVSLGVVSGSGSGTLPTIARASQPSCITWPEHTQNVGSFGDEISIHMNRKADTMTHTVRYQFGSQSGTIATGVTTGTTWVIPLSLMNLIPDSISGSGTIYVDTYNGSTKVGTKSCGFTATVPASVKPSLSVTLEDTTGIDDIYGSPVKGLSKIKITPTVTLAYGSPIASYSITANGVTYNTATATTGFLATSGSSKVTVTVKDKRGRTATWTYTMTVLDYTSPAITMLTVHRCNADGTENDQGEHVKVSFSAIISSMNTKNTATYTLRHRKSVNGTWTEVPITALNNKFTVTGQTHVFAADGNSSYDIELTAVDRHGTTIRSTSVSTAFTLINWHPSGTGIGFGKVSETENTVEFGMDADFQAPVYGMAYGLGALPSIPENADFNNYTRPGCYAVRQNVIAKTISNIPVQTAGRLYVSAATGDGGDLDPNAKYVYREQRFVPYKYGNGALNRGAWIRYLEKNNTPEFTVSPWYNEAIKAYPVGSIYIAYNHTDPATLFGGTWERMQDGFLWASRSTDTIGQTGGEKTHTLTVNELPAHSHGSVYSQHASGTKDKAWYSSSGSSVAYGTVSTGGGAAHNNMPPYIQVSIWRRTA